MIFLFVALLAGFLWMSWAIILGFAYVAILFFSLILLLAGYTWDAMEKAYRAIFRLDRSG
jgi:hypothetical protein